MQIKSLFFYKTFEKKTLEIVKNLVSFIINYLEHNYTYKKLFLSLSNILNIPAEILIKRSRQILFRSYEFEKKKFNKNYNVVFVFFDFIKLFGLLILFLITTFFYKKKKIKNVEIICDNIHSKIDLKQHQTFINYFKSVLLISYNDLEVKNNKIKSINIKKNFFNYTNFNLSKRFLLLLFSIKLFIYSLYYKFNFFNIFKYLIYDFIKYKRLYSEYNGKYYFNYRFYDTNVLQNYLFKAHGGLKTSCYQKNICILSLSCFIYTDIFFSLGTNQGKICNELGGEIKNVKPVGSFYMEGKWFKQRKDTSKLPKIDILIIGINAPWPRGCINDDFHKSYYKKFLPWIVKISKDFPNKKIYYKHHPNFPGDSREEKILASSNIKIFVNDKNQNGTYGWAYKSKIIISFASTMVVELLGNNKKAYFIDPDGINDQWYFGIKKLSKYRIKSYKNLKKIINNKNIKKGVPKKDRNYFCLNSRNTKKNISFYLKHFN